MIDIQQKGRGFVFIIDGIEHKANVSWNNEVGFRLQQHFQGDFNSQILIEIRRELKISANYICDNNKYSEDTRNELFEKIDTLQFQI